jgi:hypothetical protein
VVVEVTANTLKLPVFLSMQAHAHLLQVMEVLSGSLSLVAMLEYA